MDQPRKMLARKNVKKATSHGLSGRTKKVESTGVAESALMQGKDNYGRKADWAKEAVEQAKKKCGDWFDISKVLPKLLCRAQAREREKWRRAIKYVREEHPRPDGIAYAQGYNQSLADLLAAMKRK